MPKSINISKEFTKTPGARYRDDGPYSGQEFFEDYLAPNFEELDDNESLIVYLDGTAGFATSFLDGSFGELARKYGAKKVLEKIKVISKEDPYLEDEIEGYINENN